MNKLEIKDMHRINSRSHFDEGISIEVCRYTDLNSANVYFLFYGDIAFILSSDVVEMAARSNYGYGLFEYGTRGSCIRTKASCKAEEAAYMLNRLGLPFETLELPIPYADFERSFKCGGTRAWSLEKFLSHEFKGKWVGGFTGSNTTAIVPDGNGGTVQVVVKTDKRKITCDFVTAGFKAEVKLHGGSFSAGK